MQIAHMTWLQKLTDDGYPWVSAPRSDWFSYVSKEVVALFSRATVVIQGERLLSATTGRKVHAVAQLVEALRWKPEGRGLISRLCHWNFSLT